jgi:hypothetical protein
LWETKWKRRRGKGGTFERKRKNEVTWKLKLSNVCKMKNKGVHIYLKISLLSIRGGIPPPPRSDGEGKEGRKRESNKGVKF